MYQIQSPVEDNSSEPLPASDLLVKIVEQGSGADISVGELIDGLGERAFAIILLTLMLPIAVPGPPGLPTVFSIPLLVITAQLWLGRRRPWLPGFIRRRSVARAALLLVLRRVRPTLRRMESICRPRLLAMSGPIGERWLGVFFFLCAIVLANPIPIPFSHLPLAMALALLALGYVERDGVIIVAGLVGAVIGIVINVSLLGGIFMLGLKLLHLA